MMNANSETVLIDTSNAGINGEDQDEAGDAVARHQRQPFAQLDGLILPERERHPGGQAGSEPLNVGAGCGRDIERALGAAAEDRHHHRGRAVEPRRMIRLREPVHDRRHVAQP